MKRFPISGGAAILTAVLAAAVLQPLLSAQAAHKRPAHKPAAKAARARANEKVIKIVKTEAEWKKLLTPEQFYVMRQKGTQAPFQGDYHPRKEVGIYRCSACKLPLFQSTTKFDSGTGWPSFWKPIAGHVIETTDADGERTEVTCARCGGHLGHVFTDGPKPTGLRYCMNAVALVFDAKSK